MGDYAAQPWAGRIAARWGHYGYILLSASILGVIFIGLHPLPGLLELTVPVALMAFVVGSWLLMRQHDRRLCEQCAAAMPLNAGEQAVIYRRRLWLAHALSEPRYLVPYLIVLIGSNFTQGQGIGRLAWAVIQSSMIYLVLASATHRRLQPWCPVCRGDGGGGRDDEDSTPPPPPVDRHQLI
ncbi:MAG: hypothetical protein ABI429_06500 [Jatrophihabitantaceae bacterium]